MAIRVRLFPLILIGIVSMALLWIPYYLFMLGPVVGSVETLGSADPVPFEIAKGEGLRVIADKLEQAGLIKSAQFFKFHSLFTGNAHQLKPGRYLVSNASSASHIIEQIVAGPEDEVEVLITEGSTVQEIDEQLAAIGVLVSGELVGQKITARLIADYPFLEKAKTFEGFLFPDTYRFYYGSDPELVLRAMLDAFAEKAAQIIIDSRKGFREVLTIASMIEKEVPDSDERKVVAGIMYKRLSIDMPLQIDATIPYAKIHGELFDTYQHYGLPPGPIGNPGLDAIAAALSPKASPYLYYLSDPETDKTIFSKTFEEHKMNKEKYLR